MGGLSPFLGRDREGEVVASNLSDNFCNGRAEIIRVGIAISLHRPSGVEAVGAVVDVARAEGGSVGFV